LNLSDKKNIIFSISVEWLKPIALEFRKDYLKNYGKMLGAIAAYACDGVNLIIEAILKSWVGSPKHSKIVVQNTPRRRTGGIRFDKNGNRLHLVRKTIDSK